MRTRQINARMLTGAFVHLARRYRAHANATLRSLGVSDATALPVLFLSRLGDGVRQKDLAEEVGVEGPSLVRLLDQLQGAGFVTREEDPEDRRAKRLRLTESGRALAEKAEAALDAMRETLLRDVADEDLAVAAKVFTRLSQALEDQQPMVRP
jgi:MarR family transcriptional regulator for hemolysin